VLRTPTAWRKLRQSRRATSQAGRENQSDGRENQPDPRLAPAFTGGLPCRHRRWGKPRGVPEGGNSFRVPGVTRKGGLGGSDQDPALGPDAGPELRLRKRRVGGSGHRNAGRSRGPRRRGSSSRKTVNGLPTARTAATSHWEARASALAIEWAESPERVETSVPAPSGLSLYLWSALMVGRLRGRRRLSGTVEFAAPGCSGPCPEQTPVGRLLPSRPARCGVPRSVLGAPDIAQRGPGP